MQITDLRYVECDTRGNSMNTPSESRTYWKEEVDSYERGAETLSWSDLEEGTGLSRWR